jgi:hypothetical protein
MDSLVNDSLGQLLCAVIEGFIGCLIFERIVSLSFCEILGCSRHGWDFKLIEMGCFLSENSHSDNFLCFLKKIWRANQLTKVIR